MLMVQGPVGLRGERAEQDLGRYPDLKAAGGAPRLPSLSPAPPEFFLCMSLLPFPASLFFIRLFLWGTWMSGYQSTSPLALCPACPLPLFYMNVFISVCLGLPWCSTKLLWHLYFSPWVCVPFPVPDKASSLFSLYHTGQPGKEEGRPAQGRR